MNAEEWRLHDSLMVRFSKILYAFKFPEVLSFNADTTATGGAILQDNVRNYFRNDSLAQHALRALVHAAVEELRKVDKGGRTV